LVDAKGAKELPRNSKTHLAQDLVKEISVRIRQYHSRT
jgi:hypothetical protein